MDQSITQQLRLVCPNIGTPKNTNDEQQMIALYLMLIFLNPILSDNYFEGTPPEESKRGLDFNEKLIALIMAYRQGALTTPDLIISALRIAIQQRNEKKMSSGYCLKNTEYCLGDTVIFARFVFGMVAYYCDKENLSIPGFFMQLNHQFQGDGLAPMEHQLIQRVLRLASDLPELLSQNSINAINIIDNEYKTHMTSEEIKRYARIAELEQEAKNEQYTKIVQAICELESRSEQSTGPE